MEKCFLQEKGILDRFLGWSNNLRKLSSKKSFD